MMEYTSAEASGHFFFNVLNEEAFFEARTVVDDGIVSSLQFIHLVDTLGQFELKDADEGAERQSVASVDNLFETLPVTPEIRLENAPADVQKKQELAEKIALEFARRNPDLLPLSLEDLTAQISEARETLPQRQNADEDVLLVDGVRLKLKNGIWLLLRKSNTSAVIVFKAEADSQEKQPLLVRTMELIREAIHAVTTSEEEFSGLETKKFDAELAKLNGRHSALHENLGKKYATEGIQVKVPPVGGRIEGRDVNPVLDVKKDTIVSQFDPEEKRAHHREVALRWLKLAKENGWHISISPPIAGEATRVKKDEIADFVMDALNEAPEKFINISHLREERPGGDTMTAEDIETVQEMIRSAGEWEAELKEMVQLDELESLGFEGKFLEQLAQLDAKAALAKTSGKGEEFSLAAFLGMGVKKEDFKALLRDAVKVKTMLKGFLYNEKVLLPAVKLDGEWYNFLDFLVMNVEKANNELEEAGYGRPFIHRPMNNPKYKSSIRSALAGAQDSPYHRPDTVDQELDLSFYQPLGYGVLATAEDVEKNRKDFGEDEAAYKAALAFAQTHGGRVVYQQPIAEGHGWYFPAQLVTIPGTNDPDDQPALVNLLEKGVVYDWMHNLDNMAAVDSSFLEFLGAMVENNLSVLMEVAQKTDAEKGKGGGVLQYVYQTPEGELRIGKRQAEHDVITAASKEHGIDFPKIETTTDSPAFNNGTMFTQVQNPLTGKLGVFRDNLGPELAEVLAISDIEERNRGLRRIAQLFVENMGIVPTYKLVDVSAEEMADFLGIPVNEARAKQTRDELPKQWFRVTFEIRAWEIQNAVINDMFSEEPNALNAPEKVRFAGTLNFNDFPADGDPVAMAEARFDPLKTMDNYDNPSQQVVRTAMVDKIINPARSLFGDIPHADSLPVAARSLGQEESGASLDSVGYIGALRGSFIPIEVQDTNGPLFTEMLGSLFPQDVSARSLGGEGDLILTTEQYDDLGVFGEMLSRKGDDARQLYDHRKLPAEVSQLEGAILYALHHPEMHYNLMIEAPLDQREKFLADLKQYVMDRYNRALPEKFQVTFVESSGEVWTNLNRLVSDNPDIAAAFVTDNNDLAEESARHGLLRVVSVKEPLLQNTAVILSAEKLLKQIPDGDFYRVLTLEDLAREDVVEQILRALEAYQLLAVAA